MENLTTTKLRVGAWCVDPALGEMTRAGETVRLEPRPWYEPPFPAALPAVSAVAPPAAQHRRRAMLLAACVAASAGLAFWMSGTQAVKPAMVANSAPLPQYQNSIAVLPFSDLTEGMGHEVFADGMTEELINRFSKIPGFKVPAPTSSFYYKGKQKALAEIGKELGVNYILDGSVRKSGSTLRIAARLMKADNGFIIWSDTYDKPVDDLLMVQDDIASAVAKALTAAIEKGTAPNSAPSSLTKPGRLSAKSNCCS
jgi:TolB-like protein